MDANQLRALPRPQLQKIAQRDKIKANLKSEAIINQLLKKYPRGVPPIEIDHPQTAQASSRETRAKPRVSNASVARAFLGRFAPNSDANEASTTDNEGSTVEHPAEETALNVQQAVQEYPAASKEASQIQASQGEASQTPYTPRGQRMRRELAFHPAIPQQYEQEELHGGSLLKNYPDHDFFTSTTQGVRTHEPVVGLPTAQDSHEVSEANATDSQGHRMSIDNLLLPGIARNNQERELQPQASTQNISVGSSRTHAVTKQSSVHSQYDLNPIEHSPRTNERHSRLPPISQIPEFTKARAASQQQTPPQITSPTSDGEYVRFGAALQSCLPSSTLPSSFSTDSLVRGEDGWEYDPRAVQLAMSPMNAFRAASRIPTPPPEPDVQNPPNPDPWADEHPIEYKDGKPWRRATVYPPGASQPEARHWLRVIVPMIDATAEIENTIREIEIVTNSAAKQVKELNRALMDVRAKRMALENAGLRAMKDKRCQEAQEERAVRSPEGEQMQTCEDVDLMMDNMYVLPKKGLKRLAPISDEEDEAVHGERNKRRRLDKGKQVVRDVGSS